MKQYFIPIILLLVLLTFARAWAAPAVEISPSFTRGTLDAQVDSWTKNVSGVVPDYLNSIPERTGHLHFGYMRKPVWLRFALKNPGTHARNFVLTLDPPLLDEMSLTQVTPNGKVIATADFNLSDRVGAGALFRRRPAFRISLPAQSETIFLLRLFSTHTMDAHLYLATPELESRSALNDNLAMGAYYGVFFIIVLLNLLIYFATRDSLYLSYFCFLIALGMQLTCLNGFLDFTLGGMIPFARHLCSMSAATLIFSYLFCRNFLQTRKIAPRIDRTQLIMSILAGIIGVLHFTPLYIPYLKIFGIGIDIAIGVSILLIVASTLAAIKKGYQPAAFFLIAWGSFLGLILFYFSATYGIIHGGSLTQYAVQIGSTAEMILLSIALAYRVYLLKKSKTVAEEKARETDKLRSLIHIICHDLRNPLTVISGLAQSYVLRGHKEWVPIVKAAQSQKEILDYVRIKEAIELGKHRLEMVPVQISDAAENARFIFENRINEKKLSWQSHIEPGCAALADPTLLIHTVIANLVSNAIKFTPNGGQIQLSAFSSDDRVHVKIQDNGIGIPAALRPHLFSNEESTTRLGTNGERGHGFGMPLVKAVIESFGGSITLDSLCVNEATRGAASGTRVILSLKRA